MAPAPAGMIRRAMPLEGAWRGGVVWVVGSGPSVARVDLDEINRQARDEEAFVIAVNHACHDLPDAHVVFSKDLGMYRKQPGHPRCCVDLGLRSRSACVYSFNSTEWDWWAAELPELHLVEEWKRSHPGQCGPWPTKPGEALVTCGNSGVGALCFADTRLDGDGEIRLVGLDMDRDPYIAWARWFDESGYAHAVRARVVVYGETSLDPQRRWERVA